LDNGVSSATGLPNYHRECDAFVGFHHIIAILVRSRRFIGAVFPENRNAKRFIGVSVARAATPSM
jgi:hypothetical protein